MTAGYVTAVERKLGKETLLGGDGSGPGWAELRRAANTRRLRTFPSLRGRYLKIRVDCEYLQFFNAIQLIERFS